MKGVFGASALAIAAVLWCVTAIAQDDTGTLDEPGSSAGQVIHLHMPAHQRARHTAPAAESPAPESSAPASVDAIGAEPAAAPQAPPRAPAPIRARSEMPAPIKATTHTTASKAAPTIPFSFGEDSSGATPPPPSTPTVQTVALPPHPQTEQTATVPPRPQTVQTAAVPPRPQIVPAQKTLANESHSGLAKRGAVMFEKGASDPSPAQFNGVKLLASDVDSALESGASRVELEAYGGTPGDKSSDARRLSLKRALAVRQLLIDNGVPSARIDVRAMGGVDDHGAPDRVDIFVRT